MGCDIHWHVEIQKDDGTWERGEPMVPQRWEPEQYYTHRCKTCGEQIFHLDNPYDLLGVKPEDSTERITERWQVLRNQIEADAQRVTESDYWAGFESMRKIAALDTAFTAIKLPEIRAITPYDEANSFVGYYHVDTQNSECESFTDGSRAKPRENLERETLYSGRNYALFSLLSGVRGDPPVEGQLMCEGLPEDVSHEIYAEFEQWGVDAHSEGWADLKTLMAYPWYGNTVKRTYQLWLTSDTHKPNVEWLLTQNHDFHSLAMQLKGRVTHGDVLEDSEFDEDKWSLDGLLQGGQRPDRPCDLEVTINPSVMDAMYGGVERTLAKMAAIAPDGDMTRVRAVVWYDN